MAQRSENVDQLVDHLFRQEFGRMVSRLARILGAPRLAMVEDAVQYAMLQALQLWPYQGVPEYPQAWLGKVAYHRALDVLKSERKLRFYDDEKEFELRNQIEELQTTGTGEALRFSQEVADERLALIFVCCHPALPRPASVALTLKVVCGFGVEEIARAFPSTETAITQRLVRAKRMIRDEALRCEVPDPEQLDERLGAVLEVLYLLFTEGYAATVGDRLIKNDLCAEAIRLGRLVGSLMGPQTPREATALIALMLLHDARREARLDEAGEIVVLEEQDRAQWKREQISEALPLAEEAMRGTPGPLALQAAIAAVHCRAARAEETDWREIVRLYDELERVQPSPVVALNRAVAVAMAEGPQHGLALMKELATTNDLENYHLLYAASADMHRRLGEFAEAAKEYEKALTLVTNASERRYLKKRLKEMGNGGA